MIEVARLTDDELEELRVNVATERERRASLESIPTTVAALASTFLGQGGAREALLAAINGQGTTDVGESSA